jgi:hypothetical protein
VSGIQLESELSELGTMARDQGRNFPQEAKLSQLLAVSQNISGLKTVSQEELVQMVEQNWGRAQEGKLEDRKVLDWSSEKPSCPSFSDVKESILQTDDKSFQNESSLYCEEIQLTPGPPQPPQPKLTECEPVDQFLMQKKSLDIITERQSEFSNSKGSILNMQPSSQRSRQSSKRSKPSAYASVNQSLSINNISASVLKNHSSQKPKIPVTPDFQQASKQPRLYTNVKQRELDFKMSSVVNKVGVNTPQNQSQSYQNESLSVTEMEQSKSSGERAPSP